MLFEAIQHQIAFLQQGFVAVSGVGPDAVFVKLGDDGRRQRVAAGIVAAIEQLLKHGRTGQEVAQTQTGRQDFRQ